MKKGFVLIEIIIYSALFSIMMGGLIIVAFQLMSSANISKSDYTQQEEINFIYKKISWALTGASQINSPTSTSSSTLNTEKTNYPNNPIIIRFNSISRYIEFCSGSCVNSSDFSRLNPSNIHVDSLSFTPMLTSEGELVGMETDLKINGKLLIYKKELNI